MWVLILGFIEWLGGFLLKRRDNAYESLGKAEVKAADAQATADTMKKEADAAANAPQDKTDMEKLLEEGRL